MKTERAVRRALKRWENADGNHGLTRCPGLRFPSESDWNQELANGWQDALAWVLDFSPDPTLKKRTARMTDSSPGRPWATLAAALFPHSRSMTAEEQAEFDRMTHTLTKPLSTPIKKLKKDDYHGARDNEN